MYQQASKIKSSLVFYVLGGPGSVLGRGISGFSTLTFPHLCWTHKTLSCQCHHKHFFHFKNNILIQLLNSYASSNVWIECPEIREKFNRHCIRSRCLRDLRFRKISREPATKVSIPDSRVPDIFLSRHLPCVRRPCVAKYPLRIVAD